ncbi:MAG: HAD-IC family P-type ATPase [Gammaproteobacteria bacterium]|nr:HAD-IC family P-type ATPase [Gammaproteobacteria bacterium]MCL4775402.1 HAD-IC family P-type ATPase [Burkholderiaceae bacterium]MEB2353178.1 HAD-IC family P-type ATPase [Burkholderiaceae bacterium]
MTPVAPAPSVHANADETGGLTTAEAGARRARDGPNEVAAPPVHPLRRFASRFWGLSAWMLELICLLSLALGKWADFWVAAALLVVNAVLGFVQEQRASAAIDALRSRMQVSARVLRDGAWRTIAARELVRDDLVRVRAGDLVPADVRVSDGELRIDQSALTGESREVARAAGETLYAGSFVRRGEGNGVVVATGAGTYFGKTTQLVDVARPRLHVEEVITRVVRWLFLIVGVQVAVVLALSIPARIPAGEILPLALVLLMSAIPVALPVMFTVSMALGAIELSRQGVVVTRLSAAEDAANMDVLCADKTGTLTRNVLSLVDVSAHPGFARDDVVRDGALASREANRDPIDLAFIEAARERGLPATPARTLDFVPFSPDTRRTEARIEIDATPVRVMKGAWRVVADACGLHADDRHSIQQRAEAAAASGHRVLAVARASDAGPLRFVGLAFLSDPLRADSRQLVAELHALGIGVRMLTGDATAVAHEAARQLGVTDVSAEIFPAQKFDIVKQLQDAGHVVGMTGDGVNDAPALKQAEVGIAVSGATDVAKSAASVVLATEGLAGIVELVKGGRAIYQRVLTWIINKVSRTIMKSGFVVIPFLVTGKLVISALGMVLLVFMTDFVKITLSTDRVRPSPRPESWNIAPLARLGAVLGLVMLAEALALLAFGWHRFGLESDDGMRQTFAFQTLLFFALFSLTSIRERRPFRASAPSRPLTIAMLADACFGILIGIHGLADLRPVPLWMTATIVVFAGVCSLGLNDRLKVLLLARR